MQFDVVMSPNIRLSGIEPWSSPRVLYSVTIQLSKTVHSSVRATPASARPANSTIRLSERTLKQEIVCIRQKTRQARRRP